MQRWKIYYEKIRFSDDDLHVRPLLAKKLIYSESEILIEILYWLVMFDFKTGKIVGQRQIKLSALNLKYEPCMSISASSEVQKSPI